MITALIVSKLSDKFRGKRKILYFTTQVSYIYIMNDKREQFLKIYADLPIGVRTEIILILDNQPLTWNSAYLEVLNSTPLSKEILEKLSKLEII